MSNILIIKNGSLGDLIQANGAIKDIKNRHKNSKVLLLTSMHYFKFMSGCPYVDGVLLDKRKPRWNLIYLNNLRKLLAKYNFSHVFDLQNSSRTSFYRKYILRNAKWSSTETTLRQGETKEDFDKEPVLNRIKLQLENSGVQTLSTLKINLSWTFVNIDEILKTHEIKDYIILFPFCSKKHIRKKWPYFSELIKKINEKYKNRYSLIIAPGPNEIQEARKFDTKIILDKNESLNINQLITLIENSSFVISNDTGPAHIASHLNKKGLVLFGEHTTAKQVSIENKNFKAITGKKLSELDTEIVFSETIKALN